MNEIKLIGTAIQIDDLKTTSTVTSYLKFTMIVNNYSKEKDDTTSIFAPIVLWGNTAIRFKEMAQKNEKVFVSGRLHISSYENKEGQKRSSTSINANYFEFLKKKKDIETSNPQINDVGGTAFQKNARADIEDDIFA